MVTFWLKIPTPQPNLIKMLRVPDPNEHFNIYVNTCMSEKCSKQHTHKYRNIRTHIHTYMEMPSNGVYCLLILRKKCTTLTVWRWKMIFLLKRFYSPGALTTLIHAKIIVKALFQITKKCVRKTIKAMFVYLVFRNR